jgi:catechol 2,3-dioxygenase-like lactoylglutathione lyase family enzyme
MSLAVNPATVILPVADAARARSFYEGALGLPCRGTDSGGMLEFGLAGSSVLALMEDPVAHHAEHTAMSFEVPDIRAAMEDLGRHGITFEDYDLPQLKTVDHVFEQGGEKACWFTDPDGNILCLHEAPQAGMEYTL